jgi:hypothetical protein
MVSEWYHADIMSIARRAAAVSTAKKRSKYAVTEALRSDHRDKPMKMMTVRLPADLDARVDRAIAGRVARLSKNSALIEALDLWCRVESGTTRVRES